MSPLYTLRVLCCLSHSVFNTDHIPSPLYPYSVYCAYLSHTECGTLIISHLYQCPYTSHIFQSLSVSSALVTQSYPVSLAISHSHSVLHILSPVCASVCCVCVGRVSAVLGICPVPLSGLCVYRHCTPLPHTHSHYHSHTRIVCPRHTPSVLVYYQQ